MTSKLEVDNAVQTLINIEHGDEYTIRKVINDDVYRRRCHELRQQLYSSKGMIRNKHGSAQAQFKYSIPVDEFAALLMSGDPDALAWQRDKNDRAALHRLVARFPHWKVAGSGC